MDLHNEYETLLNYLENLSESSVKAEENTGLHNSGFKPQDIESASDKTKKLLEECQDLPSMDTPYRPKSSKGFNVERYKSLMRSKLIDDYKKSQSYERPYIGVLELVSSCVRKTFYERSKYPVDSKQLFTFPYLFLIQRVGDSVHDSILSVYDFGEINKTIVSEKYRVKGKADALKENVVYELKTIDYDKFTNNYLVVHYYQGLIYAYILNTEYNYSIDTVTLVYQFRDKLKYDPIPFDVPVDFKLAESLLERANVIHNSLTRKEVPDVIGSDEEQCKYCLYKKNCEKDESRIIQPFKPKEEIQVQKEKPKTVFLL